MNDDFMNVYFTVFMRDVENKQDTLDLIKK